MKRAWLAAGFVLAIAPGVTNAATRTYQCHDADKHVLTLVEHSPHRFTLYLSGRSGRDQSDITFDGRSVTNIETNGGVGKQASIARLFKSMVRQPRAVAPHTSSTPCPFHVDWDFSP